MKKLLKYILKKISEIFVSSLKYSKIGFYFLEKINSNIIDIRGIVKNKEIELRFFTPNRINKLRVKTFFTKEPETLGWIDGFDENSVFFDIGSNVGLYSCYAAKQKKCKVFSFEPSVFNLEILAKNIYLNELSKKIVIVPSPLTNKIKISEFNMSSQETGGAFSTFGEAYTHDGSEIKSNFLYSTPGSTLDEFISFYKLEKPKYLKIDVDGIEHLIIDGANDALSKVNSILIEINDNFKLQKEKIKEKLHHKGFGLSKKIQSSYKSNPELENTYNQIWVRKK